jgi:hypothetical protein
MLPSSAASSRVVRQGKFGGNVSLADNLTSLSRLYRYHFTAEESLKPTQAVSPSLKSITSFAEKKKKLPLRRVNILKIYNKNENFRPYRAEIHLQLITNN